MYPYWQMFHNHMGKARGDPKKLIGDMLDETSIEIAPTVRAWLCSHRLHLCYMFGDYQQAMIEAKGCEIVLSHPFGASDDAM